MRQLHAFDLAGRSRRVDDHGGHVSRGPVAEVVRRQRLAVRLAGDVVGELDPSINPGVLDETKRLNTTDQLEIARPPQHSENRGS